MSLSKLPLLFLAVLLTAPWTAAQADDSCDRFLVARAALMTSKRAQLAATQLITKEMYESYRGGVLTGQAARLLDRSLADFTSYEALDAWRRLETGKDFFEFGRDSARVVILAGTSEDAFSLEWKKCLFDDLMKQQLPAFRGWVDKVEADVVTVRLIASADPNLPPPEIVVESSPFVREIANPTQSRSQGRLIVERFVKVRRSSIDGRLIATLVATSGGATISVVVPSAGTGGSISGPQVQSIDGPARLVRESGSYRISAGNTPQCFNPDPGGSFDAATIKVTANSPEGGTWKVTKTAPDEICVLATEKGRPNDPKAMPYTVILRVDRVRSRRATD
jgi:hypothetical protein